MLRRSSILSVFFTLVFLNGCGGSSTAPVNETSTASTPAPPAFELVIPESTMSDLKVMLDSFLNSLPARAGNAQKISHYYELNNLINAAKVYQNPDVFGVEDVSELENYLIVVSEEYFKPCDDYDFYNGPPRGCRSLERVGGYYLWRSPNHNSDIRRIAHAKVEWRAAAGISEAIKVLLKSEDESIRERAAKVRELIYKEVWVKWEDREFVTSTIGLSQAHLIENADVVHYLSWLELIVDLFEGTEYAQESLMTDIQEYIELEDGYINVKCRVSGTCPWEGYELSHSNSNDLSHLDVPMYLLHQKALYKDEIVKTLKEKTWADNIEGHNFPKFDMFLNGHCIEINEDTSKELWEYCNSYWVTEEKYNASHQVLFGFVEFGQYDAELADIFIQAADVNKDGVINTDDALVKNYIVELYEMAVQYQ